MKLKMIFNFISMNNSTPPSSHSSGHDSRCLCGNLLARLHDAGVELKCRRCKRVVLIPWGDANTWHSITLQWHPSPDEKGEHSSFTLPNTKQEARGPKPRALSNLQLKERRPQWDEY